MEKKRIDTLGSCGSSDPDTYAMYSSDEEGDGGGISFITTETRCEKLFERGLEMKLCGEVEAALSYFLDCLKGMQECQYFAKLAQTLHHLGELYSTIGDLEKAQEFAVAEKLFYEAIIVSSESTVKEKTKTKRRPFGKNRLTKSSGSNPAEYGELLMKKAMEYETLARVCSKEKKFDLAVDYSGKAAKLKRSMYGSDHPETIASMENFTLMYAELGRAEYAAALQQANSVNHVETIGSSLAPEVHPKSVETEEGRPLTQPYLNISNLVVKVQETNEVTHETPKYNLPVVQILNSSPQEDKTDTHSYECKQTAHWVQGNPNESGLITKGEGQHQELVQLMQPCTLIEHPSKLSNNIQLSGATPGDVIHNGPECLEVCVSKPEVNIEHNRFCPLWVLLLGTMLEVCLLVFVVYLR